MLYQGVAASAGIGIGRVVCIQEQNLDYPRWSTPEKPLKSSGCRRR